MPVMGFYTDYKAVFDAVKTAVDGKASIGTVLLGEQFTVGDLPKAVVNAEPCPIGQLVVGDDLLEVRVRGSVILVIREYEPDDWFADVVTVMGDAVDAILADRTLGGKAFDCVVTGFSPGEIKFQDKTFYGGVVRWEAIVHFNP